MDIYTLSGLTVVGMEIWVFDGWVPRKIIGLRVNERRKANMATGTVKFFNEAKGFGYITSDEDGNDLFVHFSELQRTDIELLRDGQRVSFDVTVDKSGKQAKNIHLI
ncbi:cold-shock protein [Pseudomonas sp. RA_15y_Pfl2_54]|uniref:cold-shock protein n=1 Tax=Pseudomonas sp. RA_15y_Pfl2_54 TaxID=3088704 RepID=UPI0030DD522C